jgi:trk system potassium uptake protein TrkA
MNIIIAGAGKVGYNLAKTLSYQNNIYIIDKNIEAIDKINETLDVMSIYGM